MSGELFKQFASVFNVSPTRRVCFQFFFTSPIGITSTDLTPRGLRSAIALAKCHIKLLSPPFIALLTSLSNCGPPLRSHAAKYPIPFTVSTWTTYLEIERGVGFGVGDFLALVLFTDFFGARLTVLVVLLIASPTTLRRPKSAPPAVLY